MKYNYNEDTTLDEILGYVTSTYGEHYAGQQEIQLFDYWQSLGILTPVAIGTAMKYLARFGKKEGANRKDLLKAAHYILLALWDQSLKDQAATEQKTDTLAEDSELEPVNNEYAAPWTMDDFQPFAVPFDKLLDALNESKR